ncbi:DUF3152 domain-containing protein [Streptomyces sp. ms191]|uniref:DUF3152 domain-containing protein n=1 Tax=Streptomyces sp. ms191 TaxID=1827978 RepID=UPI0011CD3800|nr:DUF3152 domain-containing protein [Streptomyces sp. ms191]TXS21211.1 DUF3152 domain-containing protein [Streptomyces sp. ms191]
MGRHSRKGPSPAPAPTGGAGPRETAGPGTGTGRRRRTSGQDGYGTGPYGEGSYGDTSYGEGSYGDGVYREVPGNGAGRADAGRRQEPYRQDPYRPAPAGREQGRRPAYGQPVSGPGPAAPGPYGQGGSGRPVWDTPTHGTPVHPEPADSSVRGGHPDFFEPRQRPERYGDRQAGAPRTAAPQTAFIPGPRRETVTGDPLATPAEDAPEQLDTPTPPARTGGKGRAFTGIAAAAVTTVLAVVVAGQVADRDTGGPVAQAAEEPADRTVDDGSASRSDERTAPALPVQAAPPTYEQLMTRQFPIDPKLKGSGEFEAVAGFDKAPGKGRKIRYRVDVEKGLGLDTALFAQAVQKTLNDRRSWAGKGEMTFERISSGEPEFVITLASPGTTGVWCAKSGLDTTVDNVSCDSASTPRVMINAFRWAQGSETFGDKAMHAYRQMLINHEVGHRLGHSHVTCRTPGALAPVMQQQTKSLDIDDIKCRPNPWVHPGS